MKILDVPLPASADDVFYLSSAVNGTFHLYIRFDAKKEDLSASAEALVEAFNNKLDRKLAYPKAAVTKSSMPDPRARFLPMSWWDPQAVKKGYYRGRVDQYVLRILVDEEHSRVYIYESNYPVSKLE